MKPGAACRASAARIVARVMTGESLDRSFDGLIAQVDERDRALCRELAYGTLRHYPRLNGLLDQLITRPFRKKDTDIHALALIGLYQLCLLRVPEHAAVSATVDAASVLRKRQTAGLLNAVLRRYLRESETLEAALAPAAAKSCPAWLWDALGTHWSEWRDQIVEAGNQHPPMTLRVNLSRTDRDSYREALREAGIEAQQGQLSPAALTLAQAVDVGSLPGFAEGLCSVQDEAAQLAAMFLDPRDNERILDACAAPGGKSCHILELAGDCTLVAMDHSGSRLMRVQENLERLGQSAELIEADAGAYAHDGTYEAILLDVPCSATGVIRRHPDIKLLRRPDDAAGFAVQQRALLSGLWPYLADGGRLLYVSCSLLPEENAEVIANFLSAAHDAKEAPLECAGAVACEHGLQLLPDSAGSDGLYFAMLVKSAP